MQRMLATFVAMAAMAISALAPTAHAQGGDRWVLLGTYDVDMRVARDTIDVSKARGSVKGLRILAKDRPIVLSRVLVSYSDGSVHNEERRINLLTGERTRPIDQGDEERFVDKLQLFYERDGDGKSTVSMQVWALQSAKGATASRPIKVGPGAGGVGASIKPADTKAEAPGVKTIPTKADAERDRFGDVLFGVKNVGFGIDRDVIRIGAEIGQFDRIRLRVLENDMFLNNLRVVYTNGETEDVAYNADIKKDTRTRWIELKGGSFIDRIELIHRTRANFKGLARVEVYGEYTADWLSPTGSGRKYNQGWVMLGAQSAALRVGFEKDSVLVGRNQGGFKRLRLNVRDRAITLRELRVVYGNGETDIIPVNTRIDAGASYGPIDLIGKVRSIREVQLTYRSRFLDASAKGKGAAVVEVWGLH
jgi:hypothetical protein